MRVLFKKWEGEAPAEPQFFSRDGLAERSPSPPNPKASQSEFTNFRMMKIENRKAPCPLVVLQTRLLPKKLGLGRSLALPFQRSTSGNGQLISAAPLTGMNTDRIEAFVTNP